MKPLIGSIYTHLPRINGRDWAVVAIETTDQKAFLALNEPTIQKLAANLENFGVSRSEARKAAESHLVAFRALCCRCNAITADFRPWTRKEMMRALAAQNAELTPKQILEWVGRNTRTEKADRKAIYTAQTSESIGRRWSKSKEPLALFLNAALQFWTTSPEPRIPPVCLMSDSAISMILDRKGVEGDAIRKALNRAGLYRPKGFCYGYNGQKFIRRVTGR
jgi:hypothetical protein